MAAQVTRPGSARHLLLATSTTERRAASRRATAPSRRAKHCWHKWPLHAWLDVEAGELLLLVLRPRVVACVYVATMGR
jgi:hypothetical protein